MRIKDTHEYVLLRSACLYLKETGDVRACEQLVCLSTWESQWKKRHESTTGSYLNSS